VRLYIFHFVEKFIFLHNILQYCQKIHKRVERDTYVTQLTCLKWRSDYDVFSLPLKVNLIKNTFVAFSLLSGICVLKPNLLLYTRNNRSRTNRRKGVCLFKLFILIQNSMNLFPVSYLVLVSCCLLTKLDLSIPAGGCLVIVQISNDSNLRKRHHIIPDGDACILQLLCCKSHHLFNFTFILFWWD